MNKKSLWRERIYEHFGTVVTDSMEVKFHSDNSYTMSAIPESHFCGGIAPFDKSVYEPIYGDEAFNVRLLSSDRYMCRWLQISYKAKSVKIVFVSQDGERMICPDPSLPVQKRSQRKRKRYLVSDLASVMFMCQHQN